MHPTYLPLYTDYINTLSQNLDTAPLQVIAGLRACGKTTILQRIATTLRLRADIASNCHLVDLEGLHDPMALSALENLAKHPDKQYLLLDEPREVSTLQGLLESFREHGHPIIVATSRNEIALWLQDTWNAPIFKVFPMRYGEVSTHRPKIDQLEDYLYFGGLPLISAIKGGPRHLESHLKSWYHSTLFNDVLGPGSVRNIDNLMAVMRAIAPLMAKGISGRNIQTSLARESRRIDLSTIYNLLEALCGAYLIHRVDRRLWGSQEILKTQGRYYFGDTSLFATLGFPSETLNLNHLKNAVFLHLAAHGFTLYGCKNGQYEVDFWAIKEDLEFFIQVRDHIDTTAKFQGAMAPLLSLGGGHTKLLIAQQLDFPESTRDVIYLEITDFLNCPNLNSLRHPSKRKPPKTKSF